jgi:preprotein translocase subunit SecE
MAVASILAKIKSFLGETRAEFHKVIWPDRRYVTVATIIILVIVIVTTLFVMFADFAFAKVIDGLIKTFSGRG